MPLLDDSDTDNIVYYNCYLKNDKYYSSKDNSELTEEVIVKVSG